VLEFQNTLNGVVPGETVVFIPTVVVPRIVGTVNVPAEIRELPFTSSVYPGVDEFTPRREFPESQKSEELDAGAFPAPPPYNTCPAVYAELEASVPVPDA
jgi:hypothetical protein